MSQSLPEVPASRQVYYRAHGVLVTDRWFIVCGRRYAINDLRDLTYVKWSMCRARSTGVIGAVALPLMALLISPYAASILLWQAVALGSCLLLSIALASMWFHPRRYAIWGSVDDRTVELYSTTSQIEWGRIGRALRRASESARRSRPPVEMADQGGGDR